MPPIDFFKPQSEQQIRGALREAKRQARARQEDILDLAVDYIEGNQLEDVRAELSRRYETMQRGPSGQTIEPVTIPIAQRFVAESATLYNKPVERTVVDEAGNEIEEATKAVNDELAACSYNKRLHKLSKYLCVIRSCGLWFQVKRGKLYPQIVVPQRIYPVAPEDSAAADAADQDDYMGYVVQLVTDVEQYSSTRARRFVFLTAAGQTLFESEDPYEFTQAISEQDLPYRWPQVVDGGNPAQAGVEDLPLQMLTVWHDDLAVGALLPDTDAEIVRLNRELNVQLSVLLDTIRTQGWGQLVLHLMNPGLAPSSLNIGSRFAIPLGVGESAEYMGSAINYTGLVDTLLFVVKLMAQSKRQSPSDFALSGTGPESGFAKLVMSLPKLEARDEFAMQLAHIEEHIAWPRIAAAMRLMGKLNGDVSKLGLRVKFADIEFPKTVQEQTLQEEHDIKHNLTTPAKILAKRRGISAEEAQALVEENAAENKPARQQAQPQQQAGSPSVLSRLIASRQ